MKGRYTMSVMVMLLLLLGLIAVALIYNLHPKPDSKIRFGYFPDMALSPLFVAEEGGFFEEEGINVELISFGYQPQNIIPAAVSGYIDGGVIGTNRIISTISKGVEIKIVSSSSIQAYGRGSVLLIVRNESGIESPADLKDKTVGLMLAGPEEYMLDKLLKQNDLSDEDVKLIDVDFNQRIGAFKKGDLDAIFIQRTMYEKIKDNDTRVLRTASDIIENESVGALFFSDDFIEKNPEKLAKFLRAWYRAHDFINDDREEATMILSKYTNEDPDLYYDMVWPYFPSDIAVPSEGELQSLMDWMIERGYLEESVPYAAIVSHVAI